jgi:hypothetical protein
MFDMGVEILTKEDLDRALEKMNTWIEGVRKGQEEIVSLLRVQSKPVAKVSSGYLVALDFMEAGGIKRWKFDQLVLANKIRTIKKKRKVYVPEGEVERYFLDPEIQ